MEHCSGCTHSQILRTCWDIQSLNNQTYGIRLALAPHADLQLIGKRDSLVNRAQLMKAVGAASQNLQAEVQFGIGPDRYRPHCHCSFGMKFSEVTVNRLDC
jgi:hypothetical protein